MPNQFLDVRGLQEKQLSEKVRDAPGQGMLFGQGHLGQKFVFGPMKAALGTIPARAGVRYYVHSVNLTARNEAADTSTGRYVKMYSDGVDVYAQVTLVPNVANVQSNSYVLDLLTDENRSIEVGDVVASPASSIIMITYADVAVENA